MKSRVSLDMVHKAHLDVNRMLAELSMPFAELRLGNKQHGIHNRLMQNRTNLWPDGMGGTTKRDAYLALCIMRSTLGAVIDHQDNVRRARARTGL